MTGLAEGVSPRRPLALTLVLLALIAATLFGGFTAVTRREEFLAQFPRFTPILWASYLAWVPVGIAAKVAMLLWRRWGCWLTCIGALFVATIELGTLPLSELQAWFERKFAFDFPASAHPNLRVRLRGTPVRLEELTSALPAEALTRKPEGTWSIQENAGHLLDLEPLWSTRLDDYLAGRETLAAADLTNRATHEARHNERPLAEILQAFRRARLGLVSRLAGLEAEFFARTALHPRVRSPMRLVDHLFFVAEHDDHHLARIAEQGG